MGGSSNARRIDAGGVDPGQDTRPGPPLFRVHPSLSRLNANWAGAAKRIADSPARKPIKGPFRMLGGTLAPLLAVGGIWAWHGYAKPMVEQEMASLGARLAHVIDLGCAAPESKRFPEDQPACR